MEAKAPRAEPRRELLSSSRPGCSGAPWHGACTTRSHRRRVFVAITEVRQVDQQRQAGPRARRTLADLAHGPEAFRLLVEAVTDYAIFLVGPDGHILTWNLGAERIKG